MVIAIDRMQWFVEEDMVMIINLSLGIGLHHILMVLDPRASELAD